MFKAAIAAIVSVAALCAAPAFAQSYSQNFEKADSSYFLPVNQQNAVGAAIQIDSSRVHGGEKSAELTFQSTGPGYINVTTSQGGIVANGPGAAHFSLWVFGAGAEKLLNAGLLLIDAGNETFLYTLGDASVKPLANGDWRQIQQDIDIGKPTAHWGDKNTGVIQYPLRFLGLGFSHANTAGGKGQVFLDDLEITGPDGAVTAAEPPLSKALSSEARISLQPSAPSSKLPAYFYPAGALVKLNLQITDLSPGAVPAMLDWRARGVNSEILAKGRVAWGAQNAPVIQFRAARPGIIYIEAKALDAADRVIARGETRCAALSPKHAPAIARGAGTMHYGVNAHLGGLDSEDAERNVALIAALGFQYCRMDVNWDAVQPRQDVWDWSAYDRLYPLLAKYGITPSSLLAYTAHWATTGDPNAAKWQDWAFAPPRAADYAAFARQTATRYGKYSRYWEIWNEPDNDFWRGDASTYASLFAAASVAIKNAQPNAQVMNGGFSEVPFRAQFIPDFTHLEQVKPDIFAYHSHGPIDNLRRANINIDKAMKQSSWTMPRWLNESGYSSSGSNTEYEQAVTLAQKMSYAPALGAYGYFWYDLRNDGDDPLDNEHNFGLVRHDLTPKAAAVAAYTLTNVLGGLKYVRSIPVPDAPNAYAVLYANPEKQRGVLVAWNEAEGAAPVTCALPGAARRTDIMGVSRSIAANNGLAALTLSAEPIYIEFSGSADRFRLKPGVLSFANRLSPIPGEPASFQVKLRNPLGAPLRGTVRFTAPAHWSATPKTIRVDIPAGAERSFITQVRFDREYSLTASMSVVLQSASLPGNVTGRVILRPATLVRRVADSATPAGAPTVTLSKDNLVSLFEATPMQELHFRGDTDLSAAVTMTRTPQGLHLFVRVRDDIFSQNAPAGMEWQGDSLQYSIALPTGEHYEWMTALRQSGPVVSMTLGPAGVATGNLSTPVKIKRDEARHETVYDLLIPGALPGGRTLPDGFTFDLLVNDNDGGGRKGWVEWTPGIGLAKEPNKFQSIVIR
ncbi:MAG: hypothetical protein ABIY70_01220 [Capsulimonas sp.]|uniref:GH39 family glycosyl hydrolase n=1 Tax=Capsulimonas sp. TaxID=2494211 RepID=UPI0032635186